jgi:hypothetical protein
MPPDSSRSSGRTWRLPSGKPQRLFPLSGFPERFEAEVSGGFGIAAFALISHIAVTKRECATF